MRNSVKLTDWYYRADYTYFWRKRYGTIFGELEKCSMAQAKKIINRIAGNKKIFGPVAESIYWAEQGREVEAINIEYADVLKQIQPEALSWRQWDCLRFLLCSKGLLQMSHICRKNAVYRLKKYKSAYGILRRFAYVVENGYFAEAEKLVGSKEFRLLKILAKDQYAHCKDVCATLSGEKVQTDDFGKFIAHKRIVILGPAQHEKGFSDYQKEEDVVVRFSYRGKKYLPECEQETPTDISYVNGEFENYEKQGGLEDFKPDLKFFCYKRQDFRSLKGDFPKERNMYVIEPGVTFGQANMVHNAIFDCMHYEVNSIYVRNCNLYMAKSWYEKNYSIGSRDRKRMLYAFAKHDYEGQFHLLKALYNAGKFQCDEECKQVLALSVEEYIQNMETIYTG